jgi:hypothetical protein
MGSLRILNIIASSILGLVAFGVALSEEITSSRNICEIIFNGVLDISNQS